MEFCPKCGGMLLTQKGKTVCLSCNYKPKKKVKIESSEKIKTNKTVEVIDEKKYNTDPIVQMECPKCKNKKAYFWTTQTRASDEPETKFYKCTKCNYTWRVYK